LGVENREVRDQGGTAGLRALGEVFRHPPLRRLELAWLATSVGTWGGSLALAVHAFDAGGAVAVGIMALCRSLPGGLAAPVLALASDRNPRRTVLLVASATQAVVTAAAALAVGLGAPLGAVYVLACLLALVSPAYKPAQTALLPRLAATPAELSAANVAASMVSNLGFVIGAVSAGELLQATSTAAALTLLACAHAVALAPLLRIPADPRPDPDPDPDARPSRELLEGFGTVAHQADLRRLVTMVAAVTAVDGAMDVLVVVVALDLLAVGEAGVGYLNGLWGLGCVVGGPVVLRLLRRRQLTLGLVAGSLLLGASVAVTGGLPHIGVVGVALVCFGVGQTVVDVAIETLLQRLTADHVLARVFGVVEAVSVVAGAAGALGAGLLVQAIGVRSALVAVAGLMPAVALLRGTGLAHHEVGGPISGRDYALLRDHSIFAPLPVAISERLARALVEIHPVDGTEVISQGDHGDRFYLIASGEVDVIRDGVFRRTMGPGEGFGEIALLRDTPRTATVRARAGVVLLALDRDLFLEVVAGQSRSGRAAVNLAATHEGPWSGADQ
jgi:MFS family permease